MTTKLKDKGYHIRCFDKKARRMAKAGASLAGTDIGRWIARAVQEKFARDFADPITSFEEVTHDSSSPQDPTDSP